MVRKYAYLLSISKKIVKNWRKIAKNSAFFEQKVEIRETRFHENGAKECTFHDLRSLLSVSQPLRSVGTPPPFFELRRGFSCVSAARHGCSCAGASPGDAVLFPSAVHLQPSMCTCSLGRRSRTISSKGNNTTTQNKRKRN